MSTVDFATYMSGQGMTFAFAVVSSYTLAAVRVGDMPIIIKPWTFKPVNLLPYDTARPYFFLVQQAGATTWQYLYFVSRNPSNWKHTNVTDMLSTPRPPLRVNTATSACTSTKCATDTNATGTGLCPPNHYTRLFQLRSMQWNLYDEVDHFEGPARPVETVSDGTLRCPDGCGDATRNQMIKCFATLGAPGGTGYFYPNDNDYLCKVATDEPVPAVFAILPQTATFYNMGGTDDNSYPSYEVFYLTETIDRCAVNYYYSYNNKYATLAVQLTTDDVAALEAGPPYKTVQTANLKMLTPTWDPGNEITCDENVDRSDGCVCAPQPPSPTIRAPCSS